MQISCYVKIKKLLLFAFCFFIFPILFLSKKKSCFLFISLFYFSLLFLGV
jgi:hypothetical protein